MVKRQRVTVSGIFLIPNFDCDNIVFLGTTRIGWIAIETTSYKNLAVESLAFSQDGSILAVGFGNSLCLYTPETLRIKTVLSAPCGQDGSTNKLIFNLSKNGQNQQTLFTERRKQIVQFVKDFLENEDDKLLTEIIGKTKNLPQNIQNDRKTGVPLCRLSIEEKEILFKGILEQNELNFYQKLELFQKIGIHICLPADLEEKFHHYITSTMRLSEKEISLMGRSKNLSTNTKFIGHWKLQNYLKRRSSAASNGLHLQNVTFGNNEQSNRQRETNAVESMEIDNNSNFVANPVRNVSQIRHVLFATGDCSHFVIVCTEKRLLIWNLLTSRLHAAFKLSVKHITVDPCTSLVAAFTNFEECKSNFYLGVPFRI